jgi:hypothetical protein
MITDPCVIRLLAEGGAIEVFGRKESGGSWTFVTRGTCLEFDDDGNDVVRVSGVPRATDLSDVVPSHWIIFYPRLVHPELRGWFRERYDAAVASLPPHRRASHDRSRHHKWHALFDSIPPDRWSSDDEP